MWRTLALVLVFPALAALPASSQARPLPDVAPKVKPKIQKLNQARAKMKRKPRRKKARAATASLTSKVKHMGGRTYAVPRSEIFLAIESPERFQRDIGVRAHEVDGEPAGFAITRVQPGSVFSALGLKSGDRLLGTVVTGQEALRGPTRDEVRPIKNLDDVLTLLVDLKTAPQVLLQVERAGTVVALRYLLE